MTDLDPWSVQRVANFGLLNAKVSLSLLVPCWVALHGFEATLVQHPENINDVRCITCLMSHVSLHSHVSLPNTSRYHLHGPFPSIRPSHAGSTNKGYSSTTPLIAFWSRLPQLEGPCCSKSVRLPQRSLNTTNKKIGQQQISQRPRRMHFSCQT